MYAGMALNFIESESTTAAYVGTCIKNLFKNHRTSPTAWQELPLDELPLATGLISALSFPATANQVPQTCRDITPNKRLNKTEKETRRIHATPAKK